MAMDKSLLRGKTPEQKKVIIYFNATGCLSGRMSDEEYESMVMAKLNSFKTKSRAMQKIGLDEEELKEIPPVYFHGYEYEAKPAPTYSVWGKDGRARSSKYSATWLFFSSTQVYMYNIIFDMASDSKSERTEEYFYKDITNFSTSSESVEVTTLSGCGGNTISKKQIETSRFALIVPGDKFYCSTSAVSNIDRPINAMKQKLREKKQ